MCITLGPGQEIIKNIFFMLNSTEHNIQFLEADVLCSPSYVVYNSTFCFARVHFGDLVYIF